MLDLFYVLDVGDAIGSLCYRVMPRELALMVGHLLSFSINGALWVSLFAIGAEVI